MVKTPSIQNKTKRSIFKALRHETQVTYEGKAIRVTVDHSMGTLKAIRASSNSC